MVERVIEWTGPETYRDLLDHIVKAGDHVAPRGQDTYEIDCVLIVVDDPVNALPLGVGRKVNIAIGAAETAQLVGGLSDVAQLDSASNGNFARFTNDGVLKGAYGPRIFRQMPLAVERLVVDSDTRQAGVVIWRDSDLENDELRDVPCTMSLSWRIRDGALHASTHMRSNDAWLGIPYDFWAFTRLQMTLAHVLGVNVGKYVHFVDSLHLYERDVEKTRRLHSSIEVDIPVRFGKLGTDTRKNQERTPEIAVRRWNTVRLEAQTAVLGRYADKLGNGSQWYADVLRPHVSNLIMCMICRYVLPREMFYRTTSTSHMSECRSCTSFEYRSRSEKNPDDDPARLERTTRYARDDLKPQ